MAFVVSVTSESGHVAKLTYPILSLPRFSQCNAVVLSKRKHPIGFKDAAGDGGYLKLHYAHCLTGDRFISSSCKAC